MGYKSHELVILLCVEPQLMLSELFPVNSVTKEYSSSCADCHGDNTLSNVAQYCGCQGCCNNKKVYNFVTIEKQCKN